MVVASGDVAVKMMKRGALPAALTYDGTSARPRRFQEFTNALKISYHAVSFLESRAGHGGIIREDGVASAGPQAGEASGNAKSGGAGAFNPERPPRATAPCGGMTTSWSTVR